MDQLSTYDAEDSQSQHASILNNSDSELKSKESEDQMDVDSPSSKNLKNEWNSFDQMIKASSSLGEQGVSMDGKTGNGATINKKNQCDEDEEDESHLPPGVRKKNRCHSSSSSSDSDDDNNHKKHKQNTHNQSEDSDSDSSADGKIKKKTTEEKSSKVSEEETVQEPDKPTKDRSASRSKSRSQSPPSKRRRSSERSAKRSHSRERKHHRRERKGRRRSSSTSRRKSRDRDHRRKRRDRSRERKRSRSHERRRSHSRDRKRDRSRSRDKRRSRSRERRRSRSRDRYKGRSQKSRNGRSRSHSHSRSRSRSPRGAKVIKYGDKVIKAGASFGRPPSSKPMTFKEKMRQQLIKAMEEGGDASQALTDKDGIVLCTQTAGTMQLPQAQVPPPPKKPPVPLMANLVTSTASLQAATISANEAAMQSMLALQKETEEKTGVEIPKYYNPAAINPVKYAEQVQKRKLLWSKTKDKDVNSQWNATGLSSDHDDKSKEKFRKLMGIKAGEGSATLGSQEEETAEEQEKEQKQKELFDKLDKEYQFARMATHTHRGIGLGFGSAAGLQPPPS